MNSEILQPLLTWIQAHPGLAYLMVAIVAFFEGLAIVGLILPGAFILFAVGAIVGLGALELIPAWVACSTGAILGDGVSFWLGYHFKDRLHSIWPFNRYQKLMATGESYFLKHGGKSIFIGRFVGPVRPIIPVIGGMMGMPVPRYVLINITAGILWSPFYILPGLVFGASLDLAAAVAGRLALLLAFMFLVIWLVFWSSRSVYRYLAPRASDIVDKIMIWSVNHPRLGKYSSALIDPRKPESTSVLVLAILLFITFWAFITIYLQLSGNIASIYPDLVLAEKLQILRSPLVDHIALALAAFSDITLLLILQVLVTGTFLARRNFSAAMHWLATGFLTTLISLVLVWTTSKQNITLTSLMQDTGLPSLAAAMATAVYGFMAVLLAPELPGRRRVWPYSLAFLLIVLSLFARIFLQQLWLSHVVAGALLGMIWVTLLGVAYRRHSRDVLGLRFPAALFLVILLVLVPLWQSQIHSEKHQSLRPAIETRILNEKEWLENQDTPPIELGFCLPHCIPEPSAAIAGTPQEIQDYLASNGWQAAPLADWSTFLKALNPEARPDDLMLPKPFLDGKAPEWQFARPEMNGSRLVLRFWQSPVSLENGSQVWVLLASRATLRSRFDLVHFWEEEPLTETEIASLLSTYEMSHSQSEWPRLIAE